MKRIIAISAFVLMLASIAGCSAVLPVAQEEYSHGPGIHQADAMNPNRYARAHADAVDRTCGLTRIQYRKVYKAYWRESQECRRHYESELNSNRLDRSYIRAHGRLERKMRRILDADQFARWSRMLRNRKLF